ncbi:hypothetical protein GTY65_02715 [Streptomyces sp. SID8379]|uniref:DUF6226 family protein n=1 Tax=unclassified Streptomyces TaxID=2593676 RepID=UPI000372900E|nr:MULTISPECIES: DUF6226 family protein [unclassified Streptomyces]MYW62994.1 hypothetical protein [Streptomyces sp. SID8379]
MDHATLLRAVDEAFAVTGADTPPWADPHDGVEVRDEEYSRCLDPGKYRILAARADAWARALTGLGLAAAETVEHPTEIWRHRPETPLDSAVLVRPVRPDAAVLVFGFAAVDDVPRTVVMMGAGDPAVRLEQVPDCGCDACDDGSAGLLEVMDDVALAVVTGAFVHVDAGQDRKIVDTGDGWSATNWSPPAPPVEGVLAAARAGRSPYEVARGAAWY